MNQSPHRSERIAIMTTTHSTASTALLPARCLGAMLVSMGASALWLLASFAIALSIWTLASVAVDDPVLLPSPLEVLIGAQALIRDGSLLQDLFASLKRVLVGFLIAALIAVPLAITMAYFYVLRRLTLPIVTLLRPIPPIAWIPIAILWFGIGDAPSFFITATASFFPIFLNAYAGGRAVEERHIHAAQFMGAQRGALLVRILLPAALPYIWTGLKVGLGQAWMAVVAAELIATTSGLGYMIQTNRINLDTDYVLVGMVAIGLVGSLMTAGIDYLERFAIPWKAK
jgi:ABC-type nitrate/sulfonate/bicarbonate transport system permease component